MDQARSPLASEAAQHDGVIDLRPGADRPPEGHARSALIGRMRKLERLGLAEPLGPAQWHLSENAEPTLRALGERTDIIKRIHRGLVEQRIERTVRSWGSNCRRRIATSASNLTLSRNAETQACPH